MPSSIILELLEDIKRNQDAQIDLHEQIVRLLELMVSLQKDSDFDIFFEPWEEDDADGPPREALSA